MPHVRYLDRSDREDVRLHQPRCHNASAYGLRGYVDNTLPSRCYAITMILRVRRNFFEITTFPNSGIRARFYALMLYARVEHKWVVGDISHTAYQHVILWFGGIVGRDDPDQHYASAYARPVPPTHMQLVLHKGGWRVSVSPTLVESNLTTAGPCWRLKQRTWQKIVVVLMRR